MAVTPLPDDPQPTTAQKVRAVVASPRTRIPAALAGMAAIAATASFPLDAVSAVLFVLTTWELARQRR